MSRWLLENELNRRIGDPVAAEPPLVEYVAGKPMASSYRLALRLSRPHTVMLRDIANLGACEDFVRTHILQGNGQLWLTREAITVLLGAAWLGLVGPGIDQLRKAYLDEFDRLEAESSPPKLPHARVRRRSSR